jgi:tRNA 2-selenouridine synthase
LFEDEGSNIGTVHIPDCVQAKTKQAELVLLEANIEQRLKITMDAYVINMSFFS